METKNIDIRAIVVGASVFVSIISGAFFAGAQWKGMQDRERDIQRIYSLIERLESELKQYTDLEVGGLRADWERELNR